MLGIFGVVYRSDICAIGKLGDAGVDEMIDMERYGAIRHGLVASSMDGLRRIFRQFKHGARYSHMAIGTTDIQSHLTELLLHLSKKPFASSESSNKEDGLDVNK